MKTHGAVEYLRWRCACGSRSGLLSVEVPRAMPSSARSCASADALKELVQIAAMAQRTAEDVVLRGFRRPACEAAIETLRELHPGADFS